MQDNQQYVILDGDTVAVDPQLLQLAQTVQANPEIVDYKENQASFNASYLIGAAILVVLFISVVSKYVVKKPKTKD